jgi:hypothetical protein
MNEWDLLDTKPIKGNTHGQIEDLALNIFLPDLIGF